MTDLRTPENLQGNDVVSEDDMVPADDAIIGRAFRWSLIVFIAIGAAIGGMVLLMRQPDAPVIAPPRAFVPPRPIETAVAAPPIPFTDITQQAGIDFVHVNGAAGEKLLPETMGGGCAFLDFDNDGDQDILLVNSCHWRDAPFSFGAATEPARDTASTQPATSHQDASHPTHALYRNDGGGVFTDVTEGSGLDRTFYGMGAAVGDYDNDGLVDIFISALGANRLYRNLGGGRFEDVTHRAGVAGEADAWSTSAGFLDIDNDGDLDLFVCNYVRWSRDIDFAVNYTLTGIGRAYGPPNNFEGVHSYLYRNNGDGTFTDISAEAGIHVDSVQGRPMGKALGVSPCDVDGDGLIDLIVANDTVRRFFFHNQGGGRFIERGSEWGLAFDRYGNATGAMGIDSAHYRNDRALGVVIGNFANEMSSLMVSDSPPAIGGASGGVRQFLDEAIGEGIGAPTRLKLTFGAFFFDADLDGRFDLLHANGHIEDDINRVQESQQYRQGAQVFWNAGADAPSCYVEAPSAGLGDLPRPIVGRGAAYADIDGDGDLDVLLTQINGRPMLLRNDTITAAGGGDLEVGAGGSLPLALNQDADAGGARPTGREPRRWLRVRLVGDGRAVNRDAIGATIELTAGGITQTRTIMPTRSYLSQMELPATFGLGSAGTIDALRVTWPGGTRTEHAVDRLNATLTVEYPGRLSLTP